MKKISTLCLVLLSALASWAADFKSGDLYYNITSDVAPYTVEVTHHSDTTQKYTQTSVKVPSSVVNAGKTYSVIRIGEEAFAFCAIESIDLPVSITSVGVGAFKACGMLTSVGMKEGIVSIGDEAFSGCVSLLGVSIPSSVENIGTYAFSFNALSKIVLPKGLVNLGDGAFYGCSRLSSINIPKQIKRVGDVTFFSCSGLRSITCESQIPPLWGENAFYNVLRSIPVYIPCASLENYEKAAGWKEFTNLTEPEPERSELQETACDSYLWNLNGRTYTASTKDSVVLTTAEGCDSIVVLNLTINYSVKTEENAEACDSYTWAANGQTYTTTGDYTYTTTAQNGCDSTITLHLTIYPSYHVDTAAIACDEFEWYGNTYTASGDYTYTTTTINGCDSIVTLHLIVNKSTIGAPQLDTICYGETFTWNGQDYTATGEYQQTLTNAAGCDSLATLHLLVLPQMITQEEKVAVCPSQLPYSWNGQTLTTTGTYSHRVPFAGTTCDSIEHLLAFEVLPIATSETTEVACDTYTWNGNTYTASGDYTFTTTGANGCDSIATLHLTINHSVKTEETAVACDTYTWNGITYSKSGDYTYTTTAQNGCDSTITLHLTINQSVEAEVAEVACDSYTWNGKTYTTSGDYTFTTTAKNGCDSTTTLHLTINHSVKTEETAEACDSYTWVANGQTYTASGDYTHTLQTIHGCDSTITLHLTINKSVEVEETIEACDSYTWNNITYQRSGDYVQRLTAANGCDSVVTLHLTIHKSVEVVTTETACDSYTWDVNGQTYSVSGTYTDTLQTLHGCDSIVVLRLTINKSVETEETAEACDSYTWNGKTYTTSGDYTYTTTAANGCDSTITLHLTINQSVKKEETIVACDSYTWNGKTYTTSGDYTFTTTAKNGCDSITILHLTINNSVKTEETVEACDTYTWNGKTYIKSGDYTFTTTAANGCDSTITLHLTINKSVEVIKRETACDSYYWNNTGITYNQSGVYYDSLQTIHGCDSVIVLHLTINKSVEKEETAVACDSYTWNGKTYTTSGDYTFTTTAKNGCDSITTLHLTINNSVKTEETIEACDTYTWNGKTYTKSGDYTFTTTAKNGCDSTITLHLTINKSVEVIKRETACDNYYWNNTRKTYDQSGVYYDSLQTIHGCDSVIVLHLTINKSVKTEETIVACDSYTWKANGQTYTVSGDYTHTLQTIHGCDSVVTLHLTVNKSVEAEETIKACDSYTWNGKTYTKSGDYTFTTTAKNGCDSTITLHLTINKSIEVVIRETACDSYYWENTRKTYTETGIYYDTLQTIHGCDSIVVFRLTVNHSTMGEEWKTICYGETYKWHGTVYNATGDYTYTLTNSVGCDSVATLHLTVMPKMIIDNQNVAICSSDLPYTWYGKQLTSKGTYTHREQFANVDCDSIEHILKLDVLPPTDYLPADKAMICWGDTYTWTTDGKVYDETGTYTHVIKNFLGCDSLVYTLELTELPAVVNKPVEKQYICWGETYTWHGKTYDETTTDTYVVENMLGCDSIIYTLNLTELPAVVNKPVDTKYICHGDTYTWYGQKCNVEKIYTHVVKNILGCDSIVYTLDLKVLPPTEYLPADKAMICWGDTYTWATDGKVYDKTGTYTHVIKNFLGCDSLVYTLELTELPAVVNKPVEKQYICWGETYTWHGKTYDETTTDTYVVENKLGCDSIIYTLDLTELPEMQTKNESISVCPSELPYTWRGQQLTKSGVYTSYVPFVVNTDCDSLEYVLDFVVMEETKSEKTVTACDSYEWNGKVYTTSGRYTYSTTNANGCDSTAILYLTINRSTYSEEYVTVCYGETYEWNGMEYRQEGNYTVYLTNAAGCDSIAILHLTILPQMKHEYEELTLCPSDLPYLWHGQSLTKPGTYTDREQYTHYDCDRVEYHLTLKVYDFSAPAKVTMPRAICGNAVDVIAATEDVEAYIASRPSYAANATIGWQIKKNGAWATLTNEPVKGGVGEITLRYVIYSECGSLPSEEMIVPVEMPTPENDVDMDGMSIISRYNNRMYLLNISSFEAKFGWIPEPSQVKWYKVVGEVDVYGEKGDDIAVGTGHSYNLLDGTTIIGKHYALIEQMEVSEDECAGVYRTQVIQGSTMSPAPKLVPNAVRPSEMMTIKELDPNQINEIYVYSTTGEMLATYTAEKVREFMLRASNTTGYYIIDVVNNDGKHTLKYIVK